MFFPLQLYIKNACKYVLLNCSYGNIFQDIHNHFFINAAQLFICTARIHVLGFSHMRSF